MIRTAIKKALEKQGITMYRLAKDNDFLPQSLLSKFLQGGSTLGQKKIEQIFSDLGLRFSDGEDISVPDFRTALKKGLEKSGMSQYAFCHFYGFNRSALCRYLAGADTLSVEKVEYALKKLGFKIIHS